LLRKCSDLTRQELAAYRAAGANVLVYSTPFGSTRFVGHKRFQSLQHALDEARSGGPTGPGWSITAA
jgi:hypothetical protein